MAIPVYNGGPHLVALLKSIHAQSHTVHDIVISDDGSTDESLLLATQFLESAGIGYRILRNPGPPSVSANYENAIAHCQGELIFLADQDDIWLPLRCAEYVKAFADPSISLVAADSSLVDQQLRPLGVRLWLREASVLSIFRRGSSRGDVLRLLRARVVAHQIAIRSRCVTTLMRRPQGFYIEDWASWAAEVSGFCHLIDGSLTLYRQHDRQTSRRPDAVAHRHGPSQRSALVSSLHRQNERTASTIRLWRQDLAGLRPRQAAELERKLRRLGVYRSSLKARIRLFETLGPDPSPFTAMVLFCRAALANLAMGPMGLALSLRDGLRLLRWWPRGRPEEQSAR